MAGEIGSTITQSTAQHQAKLALFEAVKVALADEDKVDISFGFRWPVVHRDWVAVTDTDSEIDPATVGSRRGVDETITLGLSLGAWRPEIPREPGAAEIAASERAFGLLATVQEFVRLQDVDLGRGGTLGGTVSWCLPGSSSSAGATDKRNTQQGRLIEVAATFVCQHRIR